MRNKLKNLLKEFKSVLITAGCGILALVLIASMSGAYNQGYQTSLPSTVQWGKLSVKADELEQRTVAVCKFVMFDSAVEQGEVQCYAESDTRTYTTYYGSKVRDPVTAELYSPAGVVTDTYAAPDTAGWIQIAGSCRRVSVDETFPIGSILIPSNGSTAVSRGTLDDTTICNGVIIAGSGFANGGTVGLIRARIRYGF